MYTWIWRRLPGGLAAKLAGACLLLVAVVAVLLLVVFPWVGPRLPFDHATVQTPPTRSHLPATPSGAPVRMT